MLELIATVIITASSALLFGYWFRYTCLLILNAKTSRDFATEVAAANRLNFQAVQSELRTTEADLDQLQQSLHRDYALLTYLIGHTGEAHGDMVLEDRLLQFNYRLMAAWYSVSRHFSTSLARKALEEMSQVVAHFANAMGERAALSAA